MEWATALVMGLLRDEKAPGGFQTSWIIDYQQVALGQVRSNNLRSKMKAST